MNEYYQENQLETVKPDKEPTPHEKLMAAYIRLNNAVDALIERRRVRKSG